MTMTNDDIDRIEQLSLDSVDDADAVIALHCALIENVDDLCRLAKLGLRAERETCGWGGVCAPDCALARALGERT